MRAQKWNTHAYWTVDTRVKEKHTTTKKAKAICINFVWNFMHSIWSDFPVPLSLFLSLCIALRSLCSSSSRTLESQLILISFSNECGSDWHSFDSVFKRLIWTRVLIVNSCIDATLWQNRTICNLRASNPSCSILPCTFIVFKRCHSIRVRYFYLLFVYRSAANCLNASTRSIGVNY